MAGKSRRDAERHHAGLLQTGAYITMLAGGLSLVFFPAGLIGLSLGFLTWWTACRDLERMRQSLMDQEGYHATEQARSDAYTGMILSLCGLLWPWVALSVLWFVLTRLGH